VKRAVPGLAAAGLALGAYATLVEPTWLEVTATEIRLPSLPAAWDGVRIAHLSDLHLSRIVPAGYLARCVEATMRAAPDLVLITGDFVTRSGGWIPCLSTLLARLHAPWGVWGVLGNHDHHVSAAGVSAAVEAGGVRMLRNRHTRLERDGEPLWLVGIDSMAGDQYRLSRARLAEVDRRMQRHLCEAFAGVDPEGCRILLAHSPDILPLAKSHGVDLVLSGHTHGGQVRLPLLGATVVPSRYGARYAAGLFHEGGAHLYVTRGLGVVRLPVRFLCRPELAILTLRRG
jgi:predicted MPP superfamily phosphohydrolase